MKGDDQEVSKNEITALTKELHELVGEFRGYRKESAELKVYVDKIEARVRTNEIKMPSLEEMRNNTNKIRNSVVAAITFAVIIGGLIGRMGIVT